MKTVSVVKSVLPHGFLFFFVFTCRVRIDYEPSGSMRMGRVASRIDSFVLRPRVYLYLR